MKQWNLSEAKNDAVLERVVNHAHYKNDLQFLGPHLND